jgi:hypothetical protein
VVKRRRTIAVKRLCSEGTTLAYIGAAKEDGTRCHSGAECAFIAAAWTSLVGLACVATPHTASPSFRRSTHSRRPLITGAVAEAVGLAEERFAAVAAASGTVERSCSTHT